MAKAQVDGDHFAVDDLFPLEDNPFNNPHYAADRRNRLREQLEDESKTQKMLRGIESRTKKATAHFGDGKKEAKSDEPRGKGGNTRERIVENAKARARENLKTYINAMGIEEVKQQCLKENERITHEYEGKCDTLARDRDHYMWSSQVAEEELQTVAAEQASLKYTIELLRKKLLKMGQREMENQRKLKVFSKMEPIFEVLASRFHFTSPKEVIDRLEGLEKAQLDSYTQLLEAQEQKAELERQLEQLEKSKQYEMQKIRNEHQHALERVERDKEELQNQVKNLQLQLSGEAKAKEQYLELSFAVIDFWNKWSTDTDLVNPNSKLEAPNMGDPKQVLAALDLLLTAMAPTKAGLGLRELSALANGFWLKYFTDRPALKSRAKDIFLSIEQLLENERLEVLRLKSVAGTDKKELKLMQSELEATKRELIRLTAEMDKRKSLFVDKTGNSADAVGPSASDGKLVKPKKRTVTSKKATRGTHG